MLLIHLTRNLEQGTIVGIVHSPADRTEDPDSPFAGSPTQGLCGCVLQLVRASDTTSLHRRRGAMPLSSAGPFPKADKRFPQASYPTPDRGPSCCVSQSCTTHLPVSNSRGGVGLAQLSLISWSGGCGCGGLSSLKHSSSSLSTISFR